MSITHDDVNDIDCHSRDDSLSTVSTLGWNEPGSLTDEESLEGFPSTVNWRDQPMRRPRLGAEMAILAVTSPEIKALNLPITPSFPGSDLSPDGDPARRGRKENIDAAFLYPTFSAAETSPTIGSDSVRPSSPHLPSIDDVEGSPEAPHRSNENELRIFLDPVDDLCKGLSGGVHGETPRLSNLSSGEVLGADLNVKSGKNDRPFFDEKENLHPNVDSVRSIKDKRSFGKNYRSNSESMLLTHKSVSRHPNSVGGEEGGSNYNKRTTCAPLSISIPKPSLHRRGSCEALPTPDAIAGLQEKPPRAAARNSRSGHRKSSSGDIPNMLGGEGERYRSRIDRRTQGMRKTYSNTSLITGFR